MPLYSKKDGEDIQDIGIKILDITKPYSDKVIFTSLLCSLAAFAFYSRVPRDDLVEALKERYDDLEREIHQYEN